MNKRIASEFAVGVILLTAFIIGGIFWFESAKEISSLGQGDQQIQAPIKRGDDVAKKPAMENENLCKPHYYEGKVKVSSWIISESEDGIIIAIKSDEVSKLPLNKSKDINNQNNFTVKLIDPTDAIREKIKESSPQKPATITLQGYAEICQQPPLVSIEPATQAFKKS